MSPFTVAIFSKLDKSLTKLSLYAVVCFLLCSYFAYRLISRATATQRASRSNQIGPVHVDESQIIDGDIRWLETNVTVTRHTRSGRVYSSYSEEIT